MVGCFHMVWIRLPRTPIISVLNVSSLQATGQLSHFNFTFVSFSDLCKWDRNAFDETATHV